MNKKRLTLSILTIFVLLVAAAIFRYEYPSVGFKYYEPSYFPPGVEIHARRISITHVGTSVEQNFRTEDWVYSIQESKGTNPLGAAAQNYDPDSVKPTCSFRTTPAHTRYRLCHWIDYGRININQILFTKDGTDIRSLMPNSLDHKPTVQQLDRYVDSFKPSSTLWIRDILRSNV